MAFPLRSPTCNQETRIDGSISDIAIRTSRHGLILKERVFPRASVTDIRSSVSGSSNGKTMKRIELIGGDQVETIARWIDGDKADALVEEVRRALWETFSVLKEQTLTPRCRPSF